MTFLGSRGNAYFVYAKTQEIRFSRFFLQLRTLFKFLEFGWRITTSNCLNIERCSEMGLYDLSGTPTWQKIVNGHCIKTSCDDYASERGLCYTHQDLCHVPACDDDVYRTDDGDGYCGEHEGKCWKPNCPNPVHENGTCYQHEKICQKLECEAPIISGTLCPNHMHACWKPYCQDIAFEGGVCVSHSIECVKPYCEGVPFDYGVCISHSLECYFPFCDNMAFETGRCFVHE